MPRRRAPLDRLKHGEKRKVRVKINDSKQKRVVEIRGPGRASSYDSEKHPVLARQMTKLGATDSDLAQAFQVSTQTISAWKRMHHEFMDALEIGKEIADQEVERALYARAVGYTYTAVRFFVIEGEVEEHEYLEHCPPDVGAAQFWLRNRRPDKWKDKQPEADDARYGSEVDPAEYDKLPTAELQRLYAEKIAAGGSNRRKSGATRH